jgi:hypothetical protein
LVMPGPSVNRLLRVKRLRQNPANDLDEPSLSG